MKAGRELDALVAEKVIGYGPNYILMGTFPNYSTDIAAAWDEVVGKMIEGGYRVRVDFDAYSAGVEFVLEELHQVITGKGRGETTPYAICLAALKAKGHDLTS